MSDINTNDKEFQKKLREFNNTKKGAYYFYWKAKSIITKHCFLMSCIYSWLSDILASRPFKGIYTLSELNPFDFSPDEWNYFIKMNMLYLIPLEPSDIDRIKSFNDEKLINSIPTLNIWMQDKSDSLCETILYKDNYYMVIVK